MIADTPSVGSQSKAVLALVVIACVAVLPRLAMVFVQPLGDPARGPDYLSIACWRRT